MNENELLYQIAFTQIKGIGSIMGRNVLEVIGSPEVFFKENRSTLVKIPGITARLLDEMLPYNLLKRAEQEVAFILKKKITPLFFTDPSYPARLNETPDAPLMLFYRGNLELNQTRVLSIVGTRHITSYGIQMCEEIMRELGELLPCVLICSGLAYGVDICAHREALKNNLNTIGVLGHGLDRIYPFAHRKTAVDMVDHGGLLTEFMTGTNPDRSNFVMRNRIIAGMADATLVVESANKGGSLITANIACSYGRDVLAVPGRTIDHFSEGCNMLIYENKAQLIRSGSDILHALNWETAQNRPIRQQSLFVELTPEEEMLMDLLNQKDSEHVNQLAQESSISIGKVFSLMLDLEMQGLVKALPGGRYRKS